jgi:hypothetical protein
MDSKANDRLWDEYKYRHQHVWDTVFKVTAAVVLVSIVPYTNRDVACVLGSLAVAPPAVAIGLAVLALERMRREIAILQRIKTEHRKRQGLMDPKGGSFGIHVNLFLGSLVFAAMANAYIVLYVWRPAVAPMQEAKPSSCFATPSSEKSAPQQESAPQQKSAPQR